MTVSILTSGFPNGFTDEFIKHVNQYYHKNGTITFIASDFSGHNLTDKYTNHFLELFKDKGIYFEKANIIDDRVTSEMAVEYIKEADVIWITGGDTLKQIKYIKDFNLVPALQSSECLVIGMSAGSINMAKQVVLAKDITDNIPALSIYEGIGLVDINIEPHLDCASKAHIEEDIYEASKIATIYGLHDHSFITIVDNKMEIVGDYVIFEKVER